MVDQIAFIQFCWCLLLPNTYCSRFDAMTPKSIKNTSAMLLNLSIRVYTRGSRLIFRSSYYYSRFIRNNSTEPIMNYEYLIIAISIHHKYNIDNNIDVCIACASLITTKQNQLLCPPIIILHHYFMIYNYTNINIKENECYILWTRLS